MQWDLLLGQPGELRSQMIRREQKKTEVRLLDSLEQDTWKCQNQTWHKQQGSATALWGDFFLLNRRLQVLNLERLFRVHEAGAKQKQTTKKDLMIHRPKPPHFIWYKISSAKKTDGLNWHLRKLILHILLCCVFIWTWNTFQYDAETRPQPESQTFQSKRPKKQKNPTHPQKWESRII